MKSSEFNKGLSIQELEERHELTIAVGAEAAKDDNNDTEIGRCNDNSGS